MTEYDALLNLEREELMASLEGGRPDESIQEAAAEAVKDSETFRRHYVFARSQPRHAIAGAGVVGEGRERETKGYKRWERGN